MITFVSVSRSFRILQLTILLRCSQTIVPTWSSRFPQTQVSVQFLCSCQLFNSVIISWQSVCDKPEAEFKEFERQLKFKLWLKYGLFHLKLYSMFQDLSRCSIETSFWRILWHGSNSLNSDTVSFHNYVCSQIVMPIYRCIICTN